MQPWSVFNLTGHTADTEPCFTITFDNAKYLFGASEATVRAFLQNRRRWKKARAVFVSGVGTDRTTGLPGLLMSLADSGVPKVDLIGPSGLLHHLASSRVYCYRDTMFVNPIEVLSPPDSDSPSPVYKDDNIAVYAFPITPSSAPPMPTIPIAQAFPPQVPASSQPQPQSTKPSSAPAPVSPGHKRKRTPSPTPTPSTAAPAGTGTGNTQPQHELSSSVPSLTKRMHLPGFTPHALRDQDAQDWRRLIVQHIFALAPPPRRPPTHIGGNGGQHRNNGEPPNKRTKVGNSRDGKHGARKDNVKGASSGTLLADEDPSTAGEAFEETETDPYKSHQSQFQSLPPRQVKALQHLPQSSTRLPPYEGPSSPLQRPALAYIVVGPRVRGKFDAIKANELGIPIGRIRKDLTNGKEIQFTVNVKGDDGKVRKEVRKVRPEEVVGQSELPGVAIFLDVPSTDFIPDLTRTFEESPYLRHILGHHADGEKSLYRLHSVHHVLGRGVLATANYKRFMRMLGDGVYHEVSAPEHSTNPVTFTSAALAQLKFHQLDGDMFPLPKFSLSPEQDLTSIPDLPPNTTPLVANTVTQIRPPLPPMPDSIQRPDDFHPCVTGAQPTEIAAHVANHFEKVRQEAERYAKREREQERRSQSRSRSVSPNPAERKLSLSEKRNGPGSGKGKGKGDDVEVIMLGTGSSVPTRQRNLSGILVRIPKWGSMLLDCGEGTYGQLVRQFGSADDVLRDLKCVHITHVHADHHLGIAKVLSRRARLDPPPADPLYLIGTQFTLSYLREFQQLDDLGIDAVGEPTANGVRTIVADHAHWAGARPRFLIQEPWLNADASHQAMKELQELLGMNEVVTVDMHHRTRCFGIVLRHQDGWSLSYSGDTMPIEQFALAGNGSTLLIHESTMADDEAAQAFAKGHSTVSQAVGIAKSMRARNLLLTHFSARYPKMPPAIRWRPGTEPPEGPDVNVKDPCVGAAFDGMRVRLGELWKMGVYMPAIENSFIESMAEEAEAGFEEQEQEDAIEDNTAAQVG